ncbi:MAG TPA: alpha/beta hydrolase [Candidatus Eisenbacteria bacterium]|nr:alpha/beta hydrolase [Candidatus Eisenbacteria bacterium]
MGWAPPEEPRTSVIRLRDGRRLAFAEWGDPHGRPVIHHHGTPGSRLEHEAAPDEYRAAGVRVITPDRPGYGLSDPLPGRTLLDWPADVAELADALGLERFGVTSLSGGGVSALACAVRIPERLTGVVLTGCPGPMDRPGALRDMRLLNRAGMLLARRTPALLNAGCRLLGGAVRRHPGFFYERSSRDKPAPDRRWLSLPEVRRAEVATIAEALRPGVAGYVQDVLLLAHAWGFAPGEIAVPVQLWHGDVDTVVPLHHAQHLASAIPRASLRVCAGEGHMVMWSHLTEVLTAAAGGTRQRAIHVPSPVEVPSRGREASRQA